VPGHDDPFLPSVMRAQSYWDGNCKQGKADLPRPWARDPAPPPPPRPPLSAATRLKNADYRPVIVKPEFFSL
jgi:hypothetical protein